MANDEHVTILKQGVDAWNKWRDENPNVRPDLSEAILSRANLSGADLTGADLGGAHLYRTDLSGANLRGADLTEAKILEANLVGADLSGADLTEAKIVEANLGGAHLNNANLSGTWLVRADLDEDADQIAVVGERRRRGVATSHRAKVSADMPLPAGGPRAIRRSSASCTAALRVINEDRFNGRRVPNQPVPANLAKFPLDVRFCPGSP
jgi:hypothetical protein